MENICRLGAGSRRYQIIMCKFPARRSDKCFFLGMEECMKMEMRALGRSRRSRKQPRPAGLFCRLHGFAPVQPHAHAAASVSRRQGSRPPPAERSAV